MKTINVTENIKFHSKYLISLTMYISLKMSVPRKMSNFTENLIIVQNVNFIGK